MRRYVIHGVIGLLVLVSHSLVLVLDSAWAQADYSITAEPDWITPQTVNMADPVPESEISFGVYYQLSDIQVKADSPADHWYVKVATRIVSREGLENASQFSFSFDPSYERAELHKIEIMRGSEVLDRLGTANIQILQREEELEYHLYDGSQSLTAFIEDVRVGDILVYSYSTIGSNPVFDGRFFGSTSVSFSVPVGIVHRRILWPEKRQLHYQGINFDKEPEIKQAGAYRDYIWTRKNPPAIREDADLPGWYSPYGLLQFSEVDSWGGVVSWSLPLYKPDLNPTGELKEQIGRIADASSDPGRRVMDVLKFVQSEVRYLGIELGVGSHEPRPPVVTLQNRYGDCKDKTMLMVSMLRAMGIEAVPAFVHTTRKDQIAAYHPSAAIFNHVIVRAVINGKTYWFDPTLTGQAGSLATHMPPDYRMALVATDGTNALEEIPSPSYGEPTILTEDEIDISGGAGKPGSIKVKTTYLGPEADSMRRYFSRQGLSRIQEDYLRYYTTYYPTIKTAGEIEYSDDQATNIFTVQEEYILEQPWELDEVDNTDNVSIYAYTIFDKLNIPAKGARSMPLAVSYPANLRHSIKMIMPADFDLENESSKIEDSALVFNMKTDFQDPIYTADYELTILKDHVLPEEAAAHIANIEKARDEAGLGFYMSRPDTAASDAEIAATVTPARYSLDDIMRYGFLILIISGVIFAIAAIAHGRQSDAAWRDEAVFYPVSPLKFAIMSLATVGLYHIYWFYKNWQYYRDEYDEKVWPFWRAFFGAFWFYSLLNKIREEEEGEDNLSALLVAILSVLYLILYILFRVTDRIPFSLSAWFGAAWLFLLVMPLPAVFAVNKMNTVDSVPIRKNSRFGPMAVFGLILGTPIFMYLLLAHLHFIAAGNLMHGQHLKSYHTNYLKELDVLQEGETVESFYSTGFAGIETSGSLVTDQGVALYWQETNGTISTGSVRYEDFGDVSMVQKGSTLQDSVIRVTHKDGGNIQFYWPAEKNEDGKLIILLRSRIPKKEL